MPTYSLAEEPLVVTVHIYVSLLSVTMRDIWLLGFTLLEWRNEQSRAICYLWHHNSPYFARQGPIIPIYVYYIIVLY